MDFVIEVARAAPIVATTAIDTGASANVVIAGEFTAANWSDLTLLSVPLQEVAAMGLGVARTAVHRTEMLAGSCSTLTPLIRLQAKVDDEEVKRIGYGAVGSFVAALRANPSGQFGDWTPQASIVHIEKDIHGVVADLCRCAGGKSFRDRNVVRAPDRNDLAVPMRIPRPVDGEIASKRNDLLIGYFDGYWLSRRNLFAVSAGGAQWRINYDEAKFLQKFIDLGGKLGVNSRARCQFQVDVEIQAGRQNFFLQSFELLDIEPRVEAQSCLPLDVVANDSAAPILETV